MQVSLMHTVYIFAKSQFHELTERTLSGLIFKRRDLKISCCLLNSALTFNVLFA